MSNLSKLPDELRIEISKGMLEEHRNNGIPPMGAQHVSFIPLVASEPLDSPPAIYHFYEEADSVGRHILEQEVEPTPLDDTDGDSGGHFKGEADLTPPASLIQDRAEKEEAGLQGAAETVRAILNGDPLATVLRNDNLAVVVWLLAEEGSPLTASLDYFSLHGSMSDKEARDAADRLVKLGLLEDRSSEGQQVLSGYSLTSSGRDVAAALERGSKELSVT